MLNLDLFLKDHPMFRIVTFCVVVFILLPTKTNGSDEMSDELFLQAKGSSGQEYLNARDKILAATNSESFLSDLMADKSRSTEDRWLAEMLLFRLKDSKEFERLEVIFQTKCSAWKFQSSRRINGFSGFVHPNVFLERGSLDIASVLQGVMETEVDDVFGVRPIVPTLADLETGKVSATIKDRWERYVEAKMLPPSEHWNLVVGEIMLKGWLRSDEVDAKPIHANVEPGIGQSTMKMGLGRAEEVKIEHDTYVGNAILVLSELKEKRASSALEKIASGLKSATLSTKEEVSIDEEREPEFVPPMVTAEWLSHRELAISALKNAGNESSIILLKRLAYDKNVSIRDVALKTILEIGSDEAKLFLKERQVELDEEARARQAEARRVRARQEEDRELFAPRVYKDPPGAVDDPFGPTSRMK